MALINTFNQDQAVDNLLEAAGLKPKELANDAPLMEKLRASRLGTKELLEDLSNIISTGDTDGVRLKAIETGLKLNPETRQALNDDTGKIVPTFNIVIKDAESVSVGQILLPRIKNNVIAINETNLLEG